MQYELFYSEYWFHSMQYESGLVDYYKKNQNYHIQSTIREIKLYNSYYYKTNQHEQCVMFCNVTGSIKIYRKRQIIWHQDKIYKRPKNFAYIFNHVVVIHTDLMTNVFLKNPNWINSKPNKMGHSSQIKSILANPQYPDCIYSCSKPNKKVALNKIATTKLIAAFYQRQQTQIELTAIQIKLSRSSRFSITKLK